MEIRKLGIIGGGRVGGSIAERVAACGIEVSLVEISPDKAARSEKGMARYLDQEIAKWGITESEKKVILSKVEFSSEIERVL